MRHNHLLPKVLLGGLLLTACVDSSYDLDDIDLTLSTNADLALPLINTSNIKLVDFVLPSDFLNTTTIPGQDGMVLYASVATDKEKPTIIQMTTLKNGDLSETEYSLPNAPDITVPDMPDFLQGEDVCLDLKNPVIFADIEGRNLPDGCTIFADIEISNPDAGTKCVIKNLPAQKSKKSYYIAENEENPGNFPDEIKKERYNTPVFKRVSDGTTVNGLFSKKIPKLLKVEIKRLYVQGITGTLPITGDYEISVIFSLYAPMCIGSTNFRLSYDATETGWQEEFDEDIRKMDVDLVTIKANLFNNLPLTADVILKPIDPEGNEVKGLTILEATNRAAGSTTPIEYTLRSSDPQFKIRDFLSGSNGAQQLDGVKIYTKLKANAQSVGKYVTDKASVRFTDLELRAKGNFSYDAN